MSRKLAAACLAALVLSSAAHAEGKQYFVDAALGASDGHLDGSYRYSDRLDGTDVAGAVRVGVMWQGQADWGIEAGYVDLGQVSDQYIVFPSNVTNESRTRGMLVGGNFTYRFDAPWYLSARGGWLHSWTDLRTRVDGPYGAAPSASASGDGFYVGVGGGYDISERLSIGLHYDLYHVQASGGGADLSGDIGTAMVQLEYRY
ncbi:outer membrane beta-barrel protein [Dyella ginsengisoli]|uniref:outer membrane beta-barrel protein n=1 Tax=Dyella ginsengisoli TaxID=363848 RepID=UPI0003462576|nr:outer membrane beta-barrel protein [Dyella ginsengisoli]